MWCDAALIMMARKIFSPFWQLVGSRLFLIPYHALQDSASRWIVSSCARACWGYVDVGNNQSVFPSLAVIVNSLPNEDLLICESI